MKRILCFGDSLTEGLVGGGFSNGFKPYTIRLGELLGDSYEIANYGDSGEGTKSMVSRLPEVLNGSVNFEYAFILGGTNDLCNRPVSFIVNNLQSLHDCCASRGVKSFALAIPEMKYAGDLFENEKRISVNKALEEYANAQKNMTYIDWASALPNTWIRGEDETGNWSDNIHLSAKGYTKMAELIYEQCKNKGFFV